MNPSKSDVFCSVVTVVGGQRNIELLSQVREVVGTLEDSYTNFEFIVVDNGMSSDQVDGLRVLLLELPCIRVLRLARPSDYDTAVFGGLEAAIGDYVAVFELGVDPVNQIVRFVDQLLQGSDIVQGITTGIRSGRLFRRLLRRSFFMASRISAGIDVPDEASYMAAFSRRAVNAMVGSPSGLKYLRHLLRHVGFDVVELRYEQLEAPTARRRSGILDGIEVITSYSLRPLRVVTAIGLIAAGANLLYAMYVLLVFLSSAVERGWTTTNLQLAVMFFALFLLLAVISEYLGRILSESRQGPRYFVMEELVSSRLIADENRRNIA